jgi:hypothetical protein
VINNLNKSMATQSSKFLNSLSIFLFFCVSFSFVFCENINRRIVLYNEPTNFQLYNLDSETVTLTVITPNCMFNTSLGLYDCKRYIKIFLDIECNLNQSINIVDHNNNPSYLLYISGEIFNKYNNRLQVLNTMNESWVQLVPSIICQSNNICLFIVGFTFSYKNWIDVPISGNNVSFNCSKFSVYAFV